ncbi:hypothetical protein [Thiomicrorhabdus sp.]|uniref:hypothetical protein n=1 Tax=Thiomicrorhabdus sp. TaxID=2039724 RepID=UPI00356B2370
MTDRIRLKIDGQEWPYYTATLRFSLDQLAHTFTANIQYMTITKPLEVEWLLGPTTILKGQIDDVDEGTTATSTGITINGRSQSANFIDSRIKTDAAYNLSFKDLLKNLLSDYGLNVKNNVSGNIDPIEEFQLNAESALSGVSQLAKHRNLNLIERSGSILIERPGQFEIQDLVLEEGNNLREVKIKRSFSNLYHTYEIQSGWDNSEAIVTYEPAAKSRKCVIIADKLKDQQACQNRAEYEKNLAIAKSLVVSGKVPGIHAQLTGTAINKMVEIKSNKRKFDEKLLIRSITLNAAKNENSTDIELFRPFMENA